MKKFSKKKIFRIVWLSLVTLFIVWNWSTFQSRNLPAGTFFNDDKVTVRENDDQIVFKSNHTKNLTEVIFFQGGLADPMAYTPLCRKLAENGFTTHLIKMPYRLPLYGYQKISKLFNLDSGHYVIGGHSQGGKMAAQFVYENPAKMKGLFLIGTSNPKKIDLSNLSIPCIKLYAQNDGLATVEEVMANKNKLPRNTELILIKGGNHSQFGYLGKLLTDNSADISREEQQQLTFEHLIQFLNEHATTN